MVESYDLLFFWSAWAKEHIPYDCQSARLDTIYESSSKSRKGFSKSEILVVLVGDRDWDERRSRIILAEYERWENLEKNWDFM